jgi:Flp pilus assembly pilin Flp
VIQSSPGVQSRKRDHLGRGKSMSRRKGDYRPGATSSGQTMTEYALILVTIAIVATAFVQNAGTIINTLVSHVITLF